MADVARPALVAEILSGEDGPYDPGYPKWVPEYDRMMRNEYDTPAHREWTDRLRKAAGHAPLVW